MKIKHILETKGGAVVTSGIDASIAEVAQLIAKNRIGAVVVVDEAGRAAGVFSERDLVRVIAAQGAAALDEAVSTGMTHPVITSDRETNVRDVMEMMTSNKIRHLPVVDNDDTLVGIISIGDVVSATVARLELDRELLEVA
jgi:CBS domain-containing protein